jgi:hypothetical protein
LAYSNNLPVFLPIFCGYLVLIATQTDFTLQWLAGNGQFAIFSAALVLSMIYYLKKPSSNERLPGTTRLIIIGVVILALGVVLYVVATFAVTGVIIETKFIALPSIGLFFVAICLTAITVFLDSKSESATTKKYRDGRSKDIDDLGLALQEALRRTGGTP